MERQPPAFWWLRGVKLLQLRHAPSGTRECFDSKTEICKSTPCGLGVVRSGKQITGKYLVCVGVWASSSLLTIWWSSRLLNKIFSIPILLMCEYYRQDGLPCVHLSCPAPSFRPPLVVSSPLRLLPGFIMAFGFFCPSHESLFSASFSGNSFPQFTLSKPFKIHWTSYHSLFNWGHEERQGKVSFQVHSTETGHLIMQVFAGVSAAPHSILPLWHMLPFLLYYIFTSFPSHLSNFQPQLLCITIPIPLTK